MATPSHKLHSMWDDFPTLKEDLTAVSELIEESLDVNNKDVQAALIKMMTGRGKFLRPALTLLAGQFAPHNHKNLIALAASVEILHSASLIHDDIIDDSPLRRHQPSMQAQFGKDIAVYAGDVLFAKTFSLLAWHIDDLKTSRMATTYLSDLLQGELEQRSNYYRLDMTLSDYLTQIAGKTASLFELAIRLGTSTAPETPESVVSNLTTFAYNLGMAFQIADDILDYENDSSTLGKPTLNDLREGIYSAPLLIALEKNPALGDTLAKRFDITDDEAQAVADYVISSGALDEAKELALDYANKADDMLDLLPDSDSKDILMDLQAKLISRQD
ncbi:polyprenyl synthetase family protein [Weissella ceti]|uniref:Polyprenyl synthetase family protein n=1 Tax=Weissella ceti TaxID=759620 RepID=A0ABT3E537_9LACO|nr:polyprenyl synthetase family protein [Weissella ceti]MCW0953327.1 polyprenyl synthetase family protein [Weissella ceti]